MANLNSNRIKLFILNIIKITPWLTSLIVSIFQLVQHLILKLCHFRNIKRKLNYTKCLINIPGPWPSIPFIGTGWIYIKWLGGKYNLDKLHEANLDKFHSYGPIVKEEYQWKCPMITLYKVEDFRTVFKNQGTFPCRPASHYIRAHRQSDPRRYPNIGLANMIGTEWYDHRKRLNPVFMGQTIANEQVKILNIVGNSLVNYIKSELDSKSCNKKELNVEDIFYRYTVESIMYMTINHSLDCLKPRVQKVNGYSNDSETCELAFAKYDDATKLIEAAKTFFQAQQELYYGSFQLWKYFKTDAYQRLQQSQDLIHDIASKYIDSALHQSRNSTSTDEKSLLKTLLDVSGYSDPEIKCTITDFIGGGIFTSTNALSLLIYNLASNSSVQDKLYQEIVQVLDKDENLTFELLNKMSYLKACLQESFRFTPTVPGIARITSKDLVLSGFSVPKNTLVFCNHMITSASDKYFSEPDKFRPERWIDVEEKNKIDRFSMLPFGHGTRKCIGWRFAEHEMLVAVAKIIQNFHVDILAHDKHPQKIGLRLAFIVVPEKPIELRFTPRH